MGKTNTWYKAKIVVTFEGQSDLKKKGFLGWGSMSWSDGRYMSVLSLWKLIELYI